MADNGKWANRITDYGVQRADQFQAHPNNWRTHPKRQRQAVRTSLDTLGWVDVVKVNANTGHIVDGHERVWQALQRGDDTPVPFVALDLTEDEEMLALATLDPLTGMAETDTEMLDAILHDLRRSELVTDSVGVDALLRDIAVDTGVLKDGDMVTNDGSAIDLAAQYMILIECQTEQEQVEILQRLIDEGMTCRALIS